MLKNKFKATLPFWEKLSRYSTVGCGISIVVTFLCRNYWKEQIFYALLIGAIIIGLLIFSELMIYILKAKATISDGWNRFIYVERALLVFFIGSIAFRIINTELLNSFFSKTTQSNVFWSSLGLYAGFNICKYEYHRALKLRYEQQIKDESDKTTSPQ